MTPVSRISLVDSLAKALPVPLPASKTIRIFYHLAFPSDRNRTAARHTVSAGRRLLTASSAPHAALVEFFTAVTIIALYTRSRTRALTFVTAPRTFPGPPRPLVLLECERTIPGILCCR